MKRIGRSLAETALVFALACSARADVTASWNQDASGSWSAGGNWAGGSAAAGATGVATFSNTISDNRTVTVDSSPWTINGLTFANTGAFGWIITGGTLDLAGSAPTITVNPNSAANVYSVLTGSAGLMKAGTGTLVLFGENTYSGPLVVDAGLLVIDKGTTLKSTSGSITVSPGASLDVIGHWDGNPVANTIYLNGSGVGEYGALHLWQNQHVSGQVILSTDSKIAFDNYCNMTGPITAAGEGKNLELGQTAFNDPHYALHFYGSLNLGTGTLTIRSRPGGGRDIGYTELLNAANTYSGGTVLTDYAIVRLGNPGALGSGGVTLAPTATLDLRTHSVTLAWLSGTGGIITDSEAAGSTTLTVNQATDTTYAGVINNGANRVLSLVKTGAGALELSGPNTYTGETRVNAGKLLGATGGGCPNSPLIVADGATNGIRIVAFTSQWTCGGLTYTGGAAGLEFDLSTFPVNTDAELAPLQVNGDLNVTGTVEVAVRNGTWPATGTYPLLRYTGNLNGSGASFSLVSLPAGMEATLVNNVGAKRLDLSVTAVPSANGPVSVWTRLVGGNASGDWGDAANWSGGVPNVTDAVADFSTLDLGTTANVNNDAPHTAGILRFADTSPSHDWAVGGSALTLATSIGMPAITVNYGAYISAGLAGTQGFIKDGPGLLVLNGLLNNTISGQIVVSAGTLYVWRGASLKNTSGSITVLPGACFDLYCDWDGNALANQLYLSGSGIGPRGAAHIQANLVVNGPVTLLTDSKLTFENYCTMNGPITATGAGKSLELGQPGLFEGRYSLNIYGSISLGTGALTFRSIPGGASETGYGVALNAANTYSGGTVLTDYAILRLGNAGALGSGGVTLAPTASLDLYTFSVTIPWLSGTGGTVTDKYGAVGETTLTVNQATDTAYAGAINNGANRTLALVKDGAGSLALSGTSAYTGATTVLNGILGVDGSLASASVTVGAGGAFAAGATGVVGRATLAGTLTFQGNSRLLVDVLAPLADTVSVNGNVVIGSGVEVRVSDVETSAGGSWKIVESVAGTVSGEFVLVAGVNTARLEKIENAVWLKIPPKGTLMLLL